jgi:pteridine reductase
MTRRIALVTGGCKRVGAAIAGRLARDGWSLCLHGHTEVEPVAELRAELERSGTDWAGVVADLEDTGAPQRLVDACHAHFGAGPDLVVNSASVFEDDDADSFDSRTLARHFQINLFAPLLIAKAALAKAVSGDGNVLSVVQIVDERVRNPHGEQLSYTLSKQALAESIRTMAVALAPRARVNGVSPGLTLPTPDYTDDQWERLAGMMPLEKLPTPEDIAQAVAFLATCDSVTGQLIAVDGGASLKSYDRDFVNLARGD